MKPFTMIARPHQDILEGRLTMDVFAADLWEVFQGRAPDEYKDPELFFRKTYLTYGLKNLFDITEKRLKGNGGDPVIQLQTPFGGGKTHSLIALYHKAKEWNVKVIVIDGTTLDANETTLWGEMERQLTGKVEKLKGETSPGREKLIELFSKNQPLLILMDEVLEYTTKASGIKLAGNTNMSSQVLAFMQELTGAVATLDKSLLILTLPSSTLEHNDENIETLFQKLQKITGRMERIYTPVAEEEIADVINRRLFSEINEKEAKITIEEFIDYAEKEKIFPEGNQKATYREKFLKSFPFQPEVIEVLYKRWGSFPTFQRTRGVLRILALVVYSLKDSKNPFIRLSDFPLDNEDLKRELIKYIGSEYDGIIYADITSSDSGAKKVDKNLGAAYTAHKFGTKISTAIFMMSFSGGTEREATINDIKLACANPEMPSAIISEAVSRLKDELFYLSDNGLYFQNIPNLNRILLMKMESIENIEQEEKGLLAKNLSKNYFDVYIWPSNSRDIPDTKKLKLVVLRNCDLKKEFLENCGERPRVYKNTLIFLCPLDSERTSFENSVKRNLAWQIIENEKTFRLTDDQKKELKERVKKSEEELRESIRSFYRLVYLGAKDDFKYIDLGLPTYGSITTIDKEIYNRLKSNGDILESLSPLIVMEKYLKDKDYVESKNILESFYKTPGEMRIVSEYALKQAIKEGIKQGLFGLGILDVGKPVCKHFKEDFSPELVDGEVLVRGELCVESKVPSGEELDKKFKEYASQINNVKSKDELEKINNKIKNDNLTPEIIEKLESEIKRKEEELSGIKKKYKKINFKLDVPSGKLSDIVTMLNYLKRHFGIINIEITISANEGEINISDYEDKIKETIRQAGLNLKDENVE
ncbi:MAG: ATP-binding protein [Ignavibacterium sp.]|uniref:ATP-binding protein n=1 Tax=Ignavibacterium sp. TaxID=2651167 RepID=UPI00404A5B35